MKQGRNDKCNCGSGIKYKRCCLVKDKKQINIVLDEGVIWHRLFSELSAFNYQKALGNYCNKIFSSNKKKYGENDEDFLVHCLQDTEGMLKDIIQTNDAYHWIFWTHRIAPINAISGNSLTLRLFRMIMDLSIQKYGKRKAKVVIDKEKIVPWVLKNHLLNLVEFETFFDKIPKKIPEEIEESISLSYSIEILSYIYVYITQIYRMWAKGGILNTSGVLGLGISDNSNLDYLVNLYDLRLINVNITSHLGTYTNMDKIEFGKDGPLASIFNNLVILQLNANHEENFKIEGEINNDFKPNYIPLLINLEGYNGLLSQYATEFKEYYGFDYQELTNFIKYFGIWMAQKLFRNKKIELNIIQRGYSVGKLLELKDDLVAISKAFGITNIEDTNISFEKIIQGLTYLEDDLNNINLWTRSPIKLFYPINDELHLILYNNLVHYLPTLFEPFHKVDGSAANIKSTHFEKYVNELILNELEGLNFWVGSRKIRGNNGKEKEIDSSFSIGEYLFIAECKSHYISDSFDMGVAKEIEKRIYKMKEALIQVDEKVKFLIENKEVLSVKIPENIKFIVSIIITPYPEYTWELNSELFLADGIPRILTPKELSGVIKINPEELKNKSFCHSL